MILVFAESFEQACTHFAGPQIHKWKYVQGVEDVVGYRYYKRIDILDLGGWQSDPKKVEAWDVIHIDREDENNA